MTYKIKSFFRDIKKEISIIQGEKISYRSLSSFYLNKRKWYINDIILRSIGNNDYFLKKRMLNQYKKTLNNNTINSKNINKLISRYLSNNSHLSENRDYNKNTIEYFLEIDTKRKMYWFCWLLAEGHFRHKGLKIEINPKDGILLKRFVKDLKINPRWIYLRRQTDSRTREKYLSLVLEIGNKDFIDNTFKGIKEIYSENINLRPSIVGNKSKSIRFPDNAPKDILMAGLLGFFDGDGSHKSGVARIGNIMSQKFLNDILRIFNIKTFTVKPHRENRKINGYYLSLGSELFNQLIKNYTRSLPRKRRIYQRTWHKFPLSKDQLEY